MKTPRAISFEKTNNDAFTLIDLVAVVLISGILGALLLPALASTKPNSQAFQCVENQRQLARGWQMYAQDNDGRLARNGDEGSQPISPADTTSAHASQWCPGRVDAGAPNITDLTNILWIKAGCIYPYVNQPGVYRCPADVSTATIFGHQLLRVRSISMNAWIGPYNIWNPSVNGRIFYKESDLGVMGAANVWLFMDENPYSINDGCMAEFTPPGPTTAANLTWVDYPASYHNGGAGISFCDGHAQIRKWTDATVLNLRTLNPPSMPSNPQNCPDLPWLQAHTTRPN